MRPDTKRHLNFGLNLVMGPALPVSPQAAIELQRRLAEPDRNIVFDVVRRDGVQVVMTRSDPHLEVRIGPTAPQEFQLLTTGRNPARRVGDFADEAATVFETVRDVFPLGCTWRRDATIAHLYAVSDGPAFQYLWVQRLRQPAEGLDVLGRTVRGGGLRLVLDPPEDESDRAHAEVRIESFLQDPSQMFVEGYFDWRMTTTLDDVAPHPMLFAVEELLDAEVEAFVRAVAA